MVPKYRRRGAVPPFLRAPSLYNAYVSTGTAFYLLYVLVCLCVCSCVCKYQLGIVIYVNLIYIYVSHLGDVTKLKYCNFSETGSCIFICKPIEILNNHKSASTNIQNQTVPREKSMLLIVNIFM